MTDFPPILPFLIAAGLLSVVIIAMFVKGEE